MKTTLLATAFAGLFASVATAESIIEIVDPYALSAGASAKSGAAFFTIRNMGDSDDRLVDVRSDIAARVELHTHIMEDGVAKMRPVDAGFPVEAGSEHLLMRGADHVMFMGLNAPFVDGETINVTLVFESGLSLEVEIPVQLGRTENPQSNSHGTMDHGTMDHGKN